MYIDIQTKMVSEQGWLVEFLKMHPKLSNFKIFLKFKPITDSLIHLCSLAAGTISSTGHDISERLTTSGGSVSSEAQCQEEKWMNDERA